MNRKDQFTRHHNYHEDECTWAMDPNDNGYMRDLHCRADSAAARLNSRGGSRSNTPRDIWSGGSDSYSPAMFQSRRIEHSQQLDKG